MQKQRREQNKRSIVEKSNRQVQIAITANRRVEMEDKCRETQSRKVKRVRRTAALFEEHEETDEQVDHADEVDVDHSRRPLMEGAKVGKIGPISRISRIARALHQVVQLTVHARLIQINLHITS